MVKHFPVMANESPKLLVLVLTLLFIFSILIAGSFWIGSVDALQAPEQVHIAVTGDPSEMVITWITQGPTPTSTVEYGTTSDTYDRSSTGSNHTYNDGGWAGVIHDVVLTDLLPGCQYFYRVGDSTEGWSGEYNFTTPQGFENITFAAYADMGTGSNAQITMDNVFFDSSIAFIIHAGDISYANGDQAEWDTWFNMIQDNAANRPYMVSAGNHEDYFDYAAYLNRFNMPQSELYYSFNYSMVHFIALSSNSDHSVVSSQYNWLEADLMAASNDRAAHPWIIVFAHHPMYSSNDRHGSYDSFRDVMEPLFNLYDVDLVIAGHDHSYERTYPVNQGSCSDNGSGPFIHPADPIYIVAGTAGASLYTNWSTPQPSWSAYREADWGYVRISVDTDDNLHSEFVRQSDGLVSDEFWITKDGSQPAPVTANATFICEGDYWRYNETDPQPDVDWNIPDFYDDSWSQCPAPFGYGDDTTYGTTLTDNDASYYFRKDFILDEALISANLKVASDNYALVYLNGILIDDDSGVNHEFSYWNREVSVAPSAFTTGVNTVAVFIYNTESSSDAYMDLELTALLDLSKGSGLPPTILCADITEAVEDESFTHEYTATNPGNDALVWDVTSNATWVDIDAVTGEFTGNPPLDSCGSYYVSISVEASTGTTFSNFTLTILQDMDSDGIPDLMDEDVDGDGYSNVNDAYPLNPLEWADTDSDGTGDNADPDDDNDGHFDVDDSLPLNPDEWEDTDGDGLGNNADPDDDNDNVPDEEDAYPLDRTKWEKPSNGINTTLLALFILIFVIVMIFMYVFMFAQD